jgi:hypothetical protein
MTRAKFVMATGEPGDLPGSERSYLLFPLLEA